MRGREVLVDLERLAARLARLRWPLRIPVYGVLLPIGTAEPGEAERITSIDFQRPREVVDSAVDIRRLARVGQIAVPLQVLLARDGVARVVIDQGAAFGVGELQRERARRPFHQAILDRERIARRCRHRIALQLSQRRRIDEVVIDTDLVAFPQQRALQNERRAKLTPRIHRRRDAAARVRHAPQSFAARS